MCSGSVSAVEETHCEEGMLYTRLRSSRLRDFAKRRAPALNTDLDGQATDRGSFRQKIASRTSGSRRVRKRMIYGTHFAAPPHSMLQAQRKAGLKLVLKNLCADEKPSCVLAIAFKTAWRLGRLKVPMKTLVTFCSGCASLRRLDI